MLKNKIKAFSVLAFVLAISLSLFGLSLDKPSGFVFAAEAENSSSEESTTGNTTEAKAVAKIGETEYKTLAEAVAAAQAGETVTLVADTAENVVVNKDLTIDLGDYTLSRGAEKVYGLFVNSGNVILNAGKGGIYGGEGGGYIAIAVNNGNLTINGGNYSVGGDENGLGNSTVYIAGKGTVTINGGIFETEKSWEGFYYVLNINNGKNGTFIVKGGTFIKYNPAVGDDNMHGNFVADGFYSIKEGSVYTVSKTKPVAQIGTDNYASLKTAFEGAKKGDTVTLVADYNVKKNDDTVENQNIVSVDMTLDLNGHKITFFAEKSEYKNNVAIYVTNGATFTVTDSSAGGTGGIISTLDKSSEPGNNIGPYTFDVIDNSNLIINGGYYLGGGTVAQVETGKVTVNGGVFEINPYGKPYYYDFMFNCIDSAYIDGTATIEVNGGTFKNWDPFNSAGDRNEGVNARFTMKGVGVTKNSDGDYVATSGKVAQVVDVNGDSVAAYATLAEAVAAAKKGETVTLVADTAENVTINKNLTLDLGNYTLFSGDKDVVFTVEKGNVIINADKGGIRGGSGSDNIAIKVTEGNLTINGGNYYVGGDKNGLGNSTVYIAGTGTVTINGGVFETEKSWKDFYYVLNIQNDQKEAKFIVKGGTFKNYNPAVGDDNLGGNFVATGYASFEQEDGIYVVKECSTLKEYLVNLGTSITLKIGVNEVGKNVKVTYAYNGGEEAEIKKHADGFYYIENITPQIIDRVYTVKVYEGETVVDSKELSVLGYCDTLLGTTTATEKAKTAVKALVYYGQKAKAYLGMTESEDIAAVISKYSLTPDKLTTPEKKVVSIGTELLISSVALNVSDKNAIVYYMTKENFEKVYAIDSKYTVTVGGVKVEKGAWGESGEYYVYKGADIYAAELGTQVEVIVNDGENVVQNLVYGAYDYCASKWNDTKVGAIAKAIYAYGVACAEYRAK